MLVSAFLPMSMSMRVPMAVGVGVAMDVLLPVGVLVLDVAHLPIRSEPCRADHWTGCSCYRVKAL